MTDSGRALAFGINVDPSAAGRAEAHEVARRADAAGLDFIGIQDHPYQRRFLDTWMLMATLFADTDRIHVFPNVASLQLRGAALIAKQAASLDVLSGGRFELALGAGTFWEAIGAMSGPVRRPGEAVAALEEAIRVIRLLWSDERTVSFDGRFYALDNAHPGPTPAHLIGIWVSALKPRMLRLTGRLADGWSVSLPYAPPEQLPAMQRLIDEGATAAGRQPQAIRRLYYLVGTITEGPAGSSRGRWRTGSRRRRASRSSSASIRSSSGRTGIRSANSSALWRRWCLGCARPSRVRVRRRLQKKAGET